METVQLQCGHCKKVMAIGVEHLGGQVQCPHCRGVVQTPARTPQAVPAPAQNHEVESIFAGPESSDMAIGEQAAPKVELPAQNHDPEHEPTVATPEPDTDLTKFKPRPIYTKSVLAMYGFIFLVPYSILTTIAVLYLLLTQAGRPQHPFDMMPDPVPSKTKGGPKQVMRIPHDIPLAVNQKVPLGKSIQIGDLAVIPERVVLTDDGDLKLFLRAKNTSAKTVFEPINEAYVRYVPGKDDQPYTFLETKTDNIYNAYLGYRQSAKNGAEEGKASLNPQEETTIVISTAVESQAKVAKIAKAEGSFTWRVQLRRGFVKWRGKDVSATAVIGVEFTSAQIEREKKG